MFTAHESVGPGSPQPQTRFRLTARLIINVYMSTQRRIAECYEVNVCFFLVMQSLIVSDSSNRGQYSLPTA